MNTIQIEHFVCQGILGEAHALARSMQEFRCDDRATSIRPVIQRKMSIEVHDRWDQQSHQPMG